MSAETGTPVHGSGLEARLARAPRVVFSVYAAGAAFLTYFCMYGFRKPFAVGTYEGAEVGVLALKDALIISQIAGYALSKFIGIKFCSEIAPKKRALAIVAAIGVAELALVAVGLVPTPWKPVAIFFNGLPLGLIWGLVFGFLEGRRTSDFLGAGLCCSFVVASGFVKSTGKAWMQAGVAETWMPAVTGLTFLVPLLLGVWLLDRIPAPDPGDVQERSARSRMDGPMRGAFVRSTLGGLVPLLVLYLFLTAFRDFRDNYAPEIWTEIGRGDELGVYTLPEVYIAVGVLAVLTPLILVRRNRLAVILIYAMMMVGVGLLGGATYAWEQGWIDGTAWMTTVGLGLYLAYVPYNCVLFDRLVALLRTPGNAVFAIYVADAIGYLGAIGVVLYKQFGHGELTKWEFFRGFSYFTCALCVVCFGLSLAAFLRQSRRQPTPGE